ncbi:MAG TPA: lytic murein transglycosylase [Solirubrobacteraceae bacterium]|jgi:murein DD-endopeptidase MepM/ murein hydrolase activator NlpD
MRLRTLIAPIATLTLTLTSLGCANTALGAEGEAPAPSTPAVTSTETTPSPATQTSEQTTSAPAPTTPPPTSTTPSESPQVKAQSEQPPSATAAPGEPHHKGALKGKANGAKPAGSPPAANGHVGAPSHGTAPPPGFATPPLPSTLGSGIQGVPDFFLNSFSIPPFLLPIYQAAGSAYGIPWQVLAAINEVETDYGRDLSVSSAGAEGWMQFLPSSWAQYGVDATAQGYEDPNNPADAIFAAARYLKAAGGDKNIRAAIFSYNHSQAYVSSVLLRAQLLGGTPPGMLSAITGLTEARFPVHAQSHFADGFPLIHANGAAAAQAIPGTVIYTQAGAPVIAIQDGVITKVGSSPTLGRYISLRDAYGNTYTYAQLGSVASLYPVLELRGSHAGSSTASSASSDPYPTSAASAGVQPRSPVSAAAVSSSLAFGAAAALNAPVPSTGTTSKATPRAAGAAVRQFRAGADEVYLHQLRAGVHVIAGTVLGHVAAGEASGVQPHVLFQIRPGGFGSPLIDPKPILDGWVLLESTSIFKANGVNPFTQTDPTPGQVLLESKNQLEQQVLGNRSIHLNRCGRGDIQTGQLDRRALATLEFLSVSGLQPTVSALKCDRPSPLVPGRPVSEAGEAISLSAINGVPVAGNSGRGSITEKTIHKLLTLQGTVKPLQLTSPRAYQNATNVVVVHGPFTHIHIGYESLYASNARFARTVNSVLTPTQWIKLISRLGEIPNPRVGSGPSPAAIPDSRSSQGK